MKDNKVPAVGCETAGYARPRTRGELRKLLDSGTPCEVAAHVAEMTKIMLDGWLPSREFTVRTSENPGWYVFEP